MYYVYRLNVDFLEFSEMGLLSCSLHSTCKAWKSLKLTSFFFFFFQNDVQFEMRKCKKYFEIKPFVLFVL